jgi:octaheme c-type cytochrome (tetrathionate reductase family)
VTLACLECHKDAAKQVMKTPHWNLEGEEVMVPGHDEPMRIGKRNVINNFCIGISSNWPGCTSCHIGYGWDDENFDLSNESLVDCLVCHDTSGTYKKKALGAGHPDPSVDLLKVAKSVGRPSRVNCGTCHFQGGGGDAIKHGDLDGTLLFPSERIDIHMGKLDFDCVDCHQTREHLPPGRLLTISVDRKNRLRCTDCHEGEPHADIRLNAHMQRVACQTCHIPFMAVDAGTKMTWDWSEAGKDLGITDEHIYLKIKGRFTYARGVPPEYAWYNETSSRYILGDTIDPSKPTQIAAPLGDRNDPLARIYPFKVHRGKQIYDTENKYFISPHVHGEKGFWTRFDWPTAARIGAESTGLAFSGSYDFAPTEMFIPQNHMVTPSEKALQCHDCHGPRGRLDWLALGYESDPLGRPLLEHEEFPLLDEDEVPVQESGNPLSVTATCGMCHDVFDEAFNASHGYHSGIDLDQLLPERRLLMQQGPRIPEDEGEEMNCFLCHMTDPNHAERLHALESGQPEWSISATLVGSGLLERMDEGYVWQTEAFDEEMVEPGTSYVSEVNCGACHGAVHDGAEPLLVDIGSGEFWTTEKTGQVFSPQRIRLSGMNLKNKDEQSRSWDVHAERLVQCGDCHYSKGRPARLAGKVSERAVTTLGEQRRRCDSCHSLAETHDWLPEKDRHMKAVACESCHVPRIHMAAQEQVDQTVAQANGKPLIYYRGVAGGRIDRAAAAYIEGYTPFLLVGQSVAGEEQLIPYNLVTRWYWIDADSGEPVSEQVLRKAWLDGDKYRPDIMDAFNANEDCLLEIEELRLDTEQKVAVIRSNLRQAGVAVPEIRGEIRGYHIHHNVTHGELVNRDCSVCHPEEDAAPGGFNLSPYIPGNVMPEKAAGEEITLDGRWEISEAGKLILLRNRGAAESYRAQNAEKQ